MTKILKPFPSWLPRLVIVLHMALGLSYAGLWLMTAAKGQFWRGDFTAYYTGWAMVLDGQGEQLYNLDLQLQYQNRILSEGSFKGGLLPYINPPHAVIPFVFLAWLPRQTAFWMWSLLQGALLAWLLILLHRIASRWKPQERWLLLSSVVAFPPLLFTFMLGTFSLLMLVCVLQFYWSLKQQKEKQTGLWMVIGSFKPQVMLVPGFLLLSARRWQALLSTFVIFALFFLASLFVPGWQSWGGFLEDIRTVSRAFDIPGIVPAKMYNFKGMLTMLLGNEQHNIINNAAFLAQFAVIGVTLWLWRKRWNPSEPSFELNMAFTLLLALFFNIHVHTHDGVLLIAPAMLFYHYLVERNLPRRSYGIFILSFPIVFLGSKFLIGEKLEIVGPIVMMLILIVWMGHTLWQHNRLQKQYHP